MDVAEFKRRMDKAIDEIKSCRKRPGVNEIFVPGERSHQKAQQNLAREFSSKRPRERIKNTMQDYA